MVAERTALINQLRALMLERGIAVPQGRCKLERQMATALADLERRIAVAQSGRPRQVRIQSTKGV